MAEHSVPAAASSREFLCLGCGATDYVSVLEDISDRLLRLPGRFRYGECAQCHLLQIREVPSDLAGWYTAYERHGSESPAYAFFRKVVTGHCYAFPKSDGGELLDVGCGNGWYVQTMSRQGWRTTGYELDPAYANDLSQRLGLPVISGLQRLREYSERFDLATFNFSFEHLAEPRQTLQAVARGLKPGGKVIILVPNAQGREARLFKRRWFHLDAPRHLTFYTKEQLRRLMTETGFDQVRVSDVPVATGFAGSLSYLTFGYLHPLVWYPAILPGMLFSLVVRDGIFRVSGVKA